MEIIYDNNAIEDICTSLKSARRFFGGEEKVARSLHSKVNLLIRAQTIKDIAVQPQLHFHPLRNKGRKELEGYFAIDIAGRRCPWRLVLQPLDKNGSPFKPCNIDEIAQYVEIIGITEVSNHYE